MRVKRKLTRVWTTEAEEIVRCPKCKCKMRKDDMNKYRCGRCSFGRTGLEYS